MVSELHQLRSELADPTLSDNQRAAVSESFKGMYKRVDTEFSYLCLTRNEGVAIPEKVRAALRALVVALEVDAILTKSQRRYISRAFKMSAKGVSLDQAFGLNRANRGRPEKEKQEKIRIALSVLRHYMNGDKYTNAAEHAGNEHGIKRTLAKKYWVENKYSARRLFCYENQKCDPDKYRWTDRERERIRYLMAKTAQSSKKSGK